jgi:hypothetical protein
MRRSRRAIAAAAMAALTAGVLATSIPGAPTSATEPVPGQPYFRRVATAYADENAGGIAAEIIASAEGGNTLITTDSPGGLVAFWDITNPADPLADGTVALPGEPTSVSVWGNWALVAVNTSADYVNTSGSLVVVDVAARTIVAEHQLGGQPDSVTINRYGRYAAIAIENERDEDLAGGDLPQLPAGYLSIVDMVGAPTAWTVRQVPLTGLAAIAPEDPEPEYVDINPRGDLVAVTLQENNHIAVVDLKTGAVKNHFSAGTATVGPVDTLRDGIIDPAGTVTEPREPDTVQWITNNDIAVANEGDLDGGSRNFTIFSPTGAVNHDSGNGFEMIGVRNGHYNDKRSNSKGVEPEGLEVGRYGKWPFLFVGSERGSYVGVYRAWGNGGTPQLGQVLPTGNRPEGLHAIPSRGLFVTSDEGDPGDDIPSTITIYRFGASTPSYPMLTSADASPGVPIGWGAMSGLAADRSNPDTLYAVQDSIYKRSKIHVIDTTQTPARITSVIPVTLAGAPVDYDLEGVATRDDGGFWVASEGAGDAPSPTSPNRLLRLDPTGAIQEQVLLPADVADDQVRFGFEGVVSVGSGVDEQVYVAFQREWKADPAGLVRIGRYTPATGTWAFFHYPLDAVESPAGGWVGLSDLTYLGDGRFGAIERDNIAGRDARIKQITEFSIDGIAPAPEGSPIPVLSKVERRDLIGDLGSTGGLVLEKVEGLTAAGDGDVFVVTDNDGVDGTNGETFFRRIDSVPAIFPAAPPAG